MKLFWKNKVIMTLCLILIMIFISNDSYGNYRRRHIRKKTYSTYLIFNQPEKGLFFYYMIYKTKKRSCKVFVNLEILIYDFLNDSCKLYSKSIEIKDFRQHFSRELYNFIKLLSFSHKLSKLPLLRKKVTDEEINNIYDQIFFIPKPSKIVKQNIIIGYDIFKFYRGIHSGGEFKYLNHNYGNSYDFRARIYDTRLGRWLAVDPQQAKYPGYSPYHFGYCDPIIVIDPNGEENIVVVGNQGSSPKSDKKADGSYRYGKNRRHFLEAGLNEALRLKNESTQNGEATTLIIYQGADPAIKPYTVEEIEYITKKAAAEGINVVVVNDVDEIVDYVNYKSTEPGFFDFGENRKADLITDFSFVGHGEPDNLLVGHNDYDDMGNLRGVWNDFWSSLDLSEFDEESFDIGCRINLIACGSGLGDVFENAQKLTGGSVSGYNTTVWWGEGGLGTFRAFEKKYVPFTDPDGRNDPNRPILPENERTRTERGIRTK